MIDEIHVRNLALIREASFTPAPGLTVVTGETGAGKTALLSALKLLMGERADSSQVREGTDGALVEGRLFCAFEQEGDLAGSEAPKEAEDHVIVRRIGSDGRNRITVDGGMCAVKQLSSLVGDRIDLCGQHEHQRLMRVSAHLPLLDSWAGPALSDELAAYRIAFQEAVDARAELARVREAAGMSAAALDEARYTEARISEVNPVLGEYEEILERLPRFEHAEALALAADRAHQALSQDEGAIQAMNQALYALEDALGFDPALQEPYKRLQSASFEMEDVASELRKYRDSCDFDPEQLGSMQERVSELQDLMHRYGPTMQDVLDRLEAARRTISLVDDSQYHMERAVKAEEQAVEALRAAALGLAGRRHELAREFEALVTEQMHRLEMGSAAISCRFEEMPEDQWTKQGSERMELMYAPGAGMQPRPLVKIASGGEVSRVMLAIKVVLGDKDEDQTLVFDEVDAGVGGSTARALASVLEELSASHQVIVVTHLAQVAVKGQRHYLARKSEGDVPETSLILLEGEGRVGEIARMLAGDASSETALAHARELLA